MVDARSTPWPAAWTVREARDAYLAENGFTVATYDVPRTPVYILGLRFSVPNTPTHRRAIRWHDLHHVVTGYGTDPVGEAESSAWELRRGLAGLDLYVTGIPAPGNCPTRLHWNSQSKSSATRWRFPLAAYRPGRDAATRARRRGRSEAPAVLRFMA